MNSDIWKESSYPLNNEISDWENVCNEHGFNSKEFSSSADFLALGCSMTFGIGVEGNKNWVDIISENTNLNGHNLSGCGKSIMWSINKFFSYVNKFGNPKFAFCFFPEFYRIEIASRADHMIPKYNHFPKNNLNEKDIIRYGVWNKNNNKNEFKINESLIAENVIPKETSFDISIQYIKMLEMYCNSNNIKLFWTTWSQEESDWLDLNVGNTEFKNYISNDMKSWHCRSVDNMKEIFCQNVSECSADKECTLGYVCHEEHSNEKNFYYPRDAYTSPAVHFGFHRQIHIAETFLNAIDVPGL